MYNYYEELGINSKLSNEEIGKFLFEQKKKWINRQNASDMKKRQQAEAKIAMIEEAAEVFSDKLRRKEYDNKLEKAKKSGKVEKQQVSSTYGQEEHEQNKVDNSADDEIVIRARRVHNLGDSAATVSFCKQAIANGYYNAELYNIMGQAYWEDNNVRMAIDTYRSGIQEFPNAAILYGNLAYIYAHGVDDSQSAMNYITRALEMQPNSSYFMAIEVKCLLMAHQVEYANEKIDAYLEKNPNDQEYRREVSNAFLTYANSWIIQTKTGSSYIASEKVYEVILEARKRAEKIYPTQYSNNQVKKIEQMNKKRFNTSNIVGLFSLFFYGISVVGTLFGDSIILGVLLGIILLVSGVALVKFSFMPKWKIDFQKVAKKRDAVGWICWVLALPIMIEWWIIKFLLKLFIMYAL